MERMTISEKPHPLWDHLSIVLCKVDNGLTPYVTWLHNHTDNGYYHGHYFDNIQDAAIDYSKREG